jgi:hypothetical protein
MTHSFPRREKNAGPRPSFCANCAKQTAKQGRQLELNQHTYSKRAIYSPTQEMLRALLFGAAVLEEFQAVVGGNGGGARSADARQQTIALARKVTARMIQHERGSLRYCARLLTLRRVFTGAVNRVGI